MLTSIVGMICTSNRPGCICRLNKQSTKVINCDPSQLSHDVEIIGGLLIMLRKL